MVGWSSNEAAAGRARVVLAAAFVAGVLLAAACSEPASDGDAIAASTTAAGSDASTAASDAGQAADEAEGATSESDSGASPTTTEAADASEGSEGFEDDAATVVSQFAGVPWFLGEMPTDAVAADAGADPIRIGMINQENTPFGSFPEMRAAAEAAVRFINTELGGVGGRPIEFSACITSFSAEQSQSCAQEMVQNDVVALVGGIDVTSTAAIPILEQNGIPVIGGAPAGLAEQQSSINAFFSGGSAGAMAGFISHAVDNGADRIVIVYADFEPFAVAARDYGGALAESLGLEVEYVTFPIIATDFLPALTAATEADADAVVMLAADAACLPAMTGAQQLEMQATLYLVGACAADPIIAAAGDAIDGVIFNSEGPIDPDDPEGAIYQAAIDAYATESAGGIGTIGFRGMMNLYSLLDELGPETVDRSSVLDLLSSAVDRPSFWGHPYTCDGERIPGLAALCAPEQLLFHVDAEGTFVQIGDWVQSDDLYRTALG